MNEIYLTQDEIKQVTGLQKYKLQIRWLKDNGFTAIPRADGKPLIARQNFLTVMGVSNNLSLDPQPDFSSLEDVT